MPLNVLRLGFLGLNSARLDESRAYYTDVLGLPLVAERQDEAYFGCGFGSHALSLHVGETPGFRHIGLQIAGAGPLDDALATLRDHGVDGEIRSSGLHGIGSVIEIADPDGYRVFLYRDEDVSGSHFPAHGIAPQKLGHVALWTGDAKRAEQFYGSVLGFRMSDWIDSVFVFLRCNTDHHTVNFLTAQARGMFHMAFELRDASDLIHSCDVLGRSRRRLDWGPGRHGPGHNLYTYHRDPEGNVVELFADLDMMSSEDLGYFDPRPHHRDSPQRPKTWAFSPEIDIWGAPPPAEYRPPSNNY